MITTFLALFLPKETFSGSWEHFLKVAGTFLFRAEDKPTPKLSCFDFSPFFLFLPCH